MEVLTIYYFEALSVLLIAHLVSDFLIQRIFWMKYGITNFKIVKLANYIFSLNILHPVIDIYFRGHRQYHCTEDKFWNGLAVDQMLHLISCLVLSIPFAFV